MTKAITVAKWEYVEKVKTKTFLIGLILMPALMVLFGVVPSLLASRPDTESKIIGVYDETENLVEGLDNRLREKFKLPDGQPNYLIRNLRAERRNLDSVRELAIQLILEGQIEGSLLIQSDVLKTGDVEYRSQNVGDVRLTERLAGTLEDLIREKKLTERGIDPELIRELEISVEMKTIKINEKGEEKESGFLQTFFSGYIFIMMLFFLIVTSGQLLVRSMIEEKSNRIVEVLMSSCTARDLMAGKILGLSGLGLTQMLVWVGIGLSIVEKFNLNVIDAEHFSLLLVYFVLGYLFYAGVFVAIGAPATTEQEAQQITQYALLFPVFPIVLALPIMQNPETVWVKILTFIPLLTPTFMALRIPIQMPASWEIIGTIIILGLSSVAMMWVAAKIFRTGILIYGKRPSIPELIRWIKAT